MSDELSNAPPLRDHVLSLGLGCSTVLVLLGTAHTSAPLLLAGLTVAVITGVGALPVPRSSKPRSPIQK